MDCFYCSKPAKFITDGNSNCGKHKDWSVLVAGLIMCLIFGTAFLVDYFNGF